MCSGFILNCSCGDCSHLKGSRILCIHVKILPKAFLFFFFFLCALPRAFTLSFSRVRITSASKTFPTQFNNILLSTCILIYHFPNNYPSSPKPYILSFCYLSLCIFFVAGRMGLSRVSLTLSTLLSLDSLDKNFALL